MTVPEVVRDLMDGKDVERNFARLRGRTREALPYLLTVLGGQSDYRYGADVHPIDLNKATLDRSSTVRFSAIKALKAFGDRTSLSFLEKRRRDRYPGIRSAAAEATQAIEKRAAGTRNRSRSR